MDNSASFDAFIKDLMQKKGIEISEESSLNFSRDLMDRLNNEILSRIPDDKLAEFKIVLESENEPQISAFVRSIIPDLDLLVQEVIK